MTESLNQTKKWWQRWWVWAIIAPIAIITTVIISFVSWALDVETMPEALNALTDTDSVTVTTDNWLAFSPNEPVSTTGFILYPGARIPAEAYAPLALQIAEHGYFVAVPAAPLNLAITDINMANSVIASYPDIDKWVLGGHSLGGVSAALYTADNLSQVDGLIFVGSYPANDALASADDLAVLSIYASEDFLTTIQDVEDSKANLPASTEFVLIDGANHAQFGYYGEQNGDGVATISREEQISQTVAIIVDFLAAR